MSRKKICEMVGEYAHANGTRSRINRLFTLAKERNKAGFEKWLQYELAVYFAEMAGDNVKKQPKIEEQVDRKDTSAKYKVDLVVSHDGMTVGLELKVRRPKALAVSAIKGDIDKIGNMKSVYKVYSLTLCNYKEFNEIRDELKASGIGCKKIEVHNANFYFILSWRPEDK